MTGATQRSEGKSCILYPNENVYGPFQPTLHVAGKLHTFSVLCFKVPLLRLLMAGGTRCSCVWHPPVLGPLGSVGMAALCRELENLHPSAFMPLVAVNSVMLHSVFNYYPAKEMLLSCYSF